LLESFALGELEVPQPRVAAALKLLDLYLVDASPPDGDGETVAVADDQAVLMFPPKFAA
jgi:hypothetical protein